MNNNDKFIDYLQKYYLQFQTLKCDFRILLCISKFIYSYIDELGRKKVAKGKQIKFVLFFCWELKFHCQQKCNYLNLELTVRISISSCEFRSVSVRREVVSVSS